LKGRIPTPIVEDKRTTSELRTEKELKQADSLAEFDRRTNYLEINDEIERHFGTGKNILADFDSYSSRISLNRKKVLTSR